MESFDIRDWCYCYSLSKGVREVFRSTAVTADCNQFIVIQHLQFRVCWNPVGFVAIVYCFVRNNCNYTPWRSFIVTIFTDYYQYQTQNQQIWIIENRYWPITSKKSPYYLLKYLIYVYPVIHRWQMEQYLACLNVLLCKGVTWSWASGRRVCKGSMSTPSRLCFSIMPQLQTTTPTGTRLGMLGPTWILRLCSSTSTNSNSWVMPPGLGLYVVTITCLQPSETKTSINCDITTFKKNYDMMICIVKSL